MKTLYLECAMGAAGDMLTAALLELCPEPEAMVERLGGLGIPGVEYRLERTEKCGIQGSHVRVLVQGQEEHSQDVHDHAHDHSEHEHTHEHEHVEQTHVHDHAHEHHQGHDHEHVHDHAHEHTHHHASMTDIEALIGGLPVSENVRTNALSVYGLIAQAEAQAHGKPVSEIHFHEVGTMDAVADVVAVCYLLEALAPEKIVVSPIQVGSGHVHCAHGILPVPAPATAYILRDVPIYSGSIQGELCTPTGAALLRHFAGEFGSMPMMRVEKIGYGMGTKDFPVANCVRAMLGTMEDLSDQVLELQCNLDDMTPEDIGFATERLLEAGALDVYTTPIQMKKNRPGVLLSCLILPQERQRFLELLFRHTTTLGVRETEHRRAILDRKTAEKNTPYGVVPVKVASGWGVRREKPEYEALQKIAREQDISLEELRKTFER
jgi:uncharacterized protein (TIGR00299 family) protein